MALDFYSRVNRQTAIQFLEWNLLYEELPQIIEQEIFSLLREFYKPDKDSGTSGGRDLALIPENDQRLLLGDDFSQVKIQRFLTYIAGK